MKIIAKENISLVNGKPILATVSRELDGKVVSWSFQHTAQHSVITFIQGIAPACRADRHIFWQASEQFFINVGAAKKFRNGGVSGRWLPLNSVGLKPYAIERPKKVWDFRYFYQRVMAICFPPYNLITQ